MTTAPAPDRLAVTKALTAVDPDNAELRAARDGGIPVEPWQQVIADAAAGRTLVAVAGTHGKSTTAGWLVHVLTQAGMDPSAFVGALLPSGLTGGTPATARIGRGAPFVVEADEYAGNFDAYRPAVAVLTSAEWDHPDVFADAAAVEAPSRTGLRRCPPAGRSSPTSVTPASRRSSAASLRRPAAPWAADQAQRRKAASPSVPGGSDPRGRTRRDDARAPRPGRYRWPVTVRLPTAGRHNAANALGVAGPRCALGRRRRRRSRAVSRRSRASVDGSSARARPTASWSTTTTATTPPRSGRRSKRSASASRADACGRSTSH